MKLKNKLILSYMMIILGIVVLVFVTTGKGMKRLSVENTKIAQSGVEKIVKMNNELSSWILTEAGQRLVQMQSEIVANKLKLSLIKIKQPYDYDQLRKDNGIREIATQPIYVPGYEQNMVAGNMDLIDINGVAVIHPNKLVEGQNYQEWEKKYPEMWRMVKESFTKHKVSGYYTFIDENNQAVNKFMVLTRIDGTPFIVCAFVEINKYFVPIQQQFIEFGNRHKALVETKMEIASDKALSQMQILGSVGGIILILIGIFLSVWQANSIALPLQHLCKSVEEMGKGNFSTTVPEQGFSEIAGLAATFNRLGGELTEYMENLKKETSARQAIESEIAVTRKIQESLLPHTFPPFPEKKEFDLFASLVPAKDVSGDFYDFFFVEDDTLVLIIADVSGKGLPASLFMAVTRTLLRNLCMNAENYSPDKVLRKANNYLCQDNDSCMFVTVFMAFYNIQSGKLVYGNAGHSEMISKRGIDDIKHFGSFPDLPLGVIPDYDYQKDEYQLQQQETLVFYTDGVTEAVNQKDEQYGLKSLTDKICQFESKTQLKIIIDDLNKDLQEYQGEKQFDDITIMMLRRNT